jgi:hypothetical protein
MFKKLLNFNYKRNTKEAIGFFIFYSFFFFLIFFIAGFSMAIFSGRGGYGLEMIQKTAFSFGYGIEIILGFIFIVIFLIKKDLPSKIKSFLIGVLLLFSMFFLGFLIILIPISFLTTFPSKENKDIQKDENIFGKIIKIVSLFLLISFSILLIMLLYNIIESFQDIIYLMISETSN